MRAIRKMPAMMALAMWAFAVPHAMAQTNRTDSAEVLRTWYRLSLELVRHTPTQSPPVASRAFAYLGVTAFEAVASGSDDLNSLAGQLNELEGAPPRETGETYDEAVVVEVAMASAVKALFGNTGPTGQRAIAAIERKLGAAISAGIAAVVAARSAAYGEAVAAHILKWSQGDGGAVASLGCGRGLVA